MIKTIALFSIFLMAVTFTAIEWSDVSQHEPVSAKNYWPYIKARSHYYHPPTLGRVNNTDYSQSKTVPVLWLQWFSCWVLRTAISRAQPPRAGQSSRKLVIKARYCYILDEVRGLNYGVFIPLIMMYPKANIPCIQISLSSSLDAGFHIQVWRASVSLKNDNLLILGLGYSFHNMAAMMGAKDALANKKPAIWDMAGADL